jgi:hypothetical protein
MTRQHVLADRLGRCFELRPISTGDSAHTGLMPSGIAARDAPGA